jgi:DNA-binding transcriptional LysR family regulator
MPRPIARVSAPKLQACSSGKRSNNRHSVLVQPWLDRGELVILPSLLPPLRRDFALLQRPAHTLTAPLSAFVQACHAHGQLHQDQN